MAKPATATGQLDGPQPRTSVSEVRPRWPEGPWRGVEHVEIETLNWVEWFNHERPHESIDDLTPVQAEEVHYAARNELTPTG